MTFEIKYFGEPGKPVNMRLPVFCPGDGGRERADAARMNDFYEHLARCIADFSASPAFPPGARYSADAVCSEEGDGKVAVVVRLSLFHRGRCAARREIRHVWQDGVILTDGKMKKSRHKKK